MQSLFVRQAVCEIARCASLERESIHYGARSEALFTKRRCDLAQRILSWRLFRCASDQHYDFSPGRIFRKASRKLRNISAGKLFEFFRELASNDSIATCSAGICEFLQCVTEPERRFIYDRCVLHPHDFTQDTEALLAFSRKKSKEREMISGETGPDERREEGRCARDRDDVNASIDGCSNESRAWIREKRRSGISDERDRVTVHQSLHQAGSLAGFIVLMIRRRFRLYLVMVEKTSRVSRILSNDKRGRRKDLDRAK